MRELVTDFFVVTFPKDPKPTDNFVERNVPSTSDGPWVKGIPFGS